MKTSKLLLTVLLCGIFFVPFCESKNCSQLLTCSFGDITKSISEHERQIQIINFVADVGIIDSLIPKNILNTNLTVEVTNVKKISENKDEIFMLNKSAITVFESVKTLSKYNRKVEFTNDGPKEFQFFVHIPKATINEIAASIGEVHAYEDYNRGGYRNKYDQTEIIYSQYFLVDEGKFIKLYTFDWFTSAKTYGKKKIVEVNRFDKNIRNWKKTSFKMKKFSNFHGCKLTFNTYIAIAEMITKNASGFLSDIFKDLEKSFNFKMEFPSNENGPLSMIRFMKIELFIRNECLPPLILDGFLIPIDSVEYHSKQHLSQSYFSATELMVVPLGQEYSGYEKLLFPFDYFTWFLVIFTFAAAYVTIFIINFASIKIRNLVYGEQVKSPSLNVAAHFFGLGQLVLPRRNFARFLVMSFIIYSLIIRTAWQAKIFEFMNQEMRKPQVESLVDAIEKDFKFHIETCSKMKKSETHEECADRIGPGNGFCHETCGIDERYVSYVIFFARVFRRIKSYP
jgi:hypothetical protein